jgi:hypothetical protein
MTNGLRPPHGRRRTRTSDLTDVKGVPICPDPAYFAWLPTFLAGNRRSRGYYRRV